MTFSSGFRLKFRKWFKYGLKAAQKLLAQGSASKQHALKGQKLLAQGNASKQHALKEQKLLAQGNASKQHALKGQKLLAQGNALGIMPICKAPCKGKSFVYCPVF